MKFYHSVVIELYILHYYTTCKDAFANNFRLRTPEACEEQFASTRQTLRAQNAQNCRVQQIYMSPVLKNLSTIHAEYFLLKNPFFVSLQKF